MRFYDLVMIPTKKLIEYNGLPEEEKKKIIVLFHLIQIIPLISNYLTFIEKNWKTIKEMQSEDDKALESIRKIKSLINDLLNEVKSGKDIIKSLKSFVNRYYEIFKDGFINNPMHFTPSLLISVVRDYISILYLTFNRDLKTFTDFLEYFEELSKNYVNKLENNLMKEFPKIYEKFKDYFEKIGKDITFALRLGWASHHSPEKQTIYIMLHGIIEGDPKREISYFEEIIHALHHIYYENTDAITSEFITAVILEKLVNHVSGNTNNLKHILKNNPPNKDFLIDYEIIKLLAHDLIKNYGKKFYTWFEENFETIAKSKKEELLELIKTEFGKNMINKYFK